MVVEIGQHPPLSIGIDDHGIERECGTPCRRWGPATIERVEGLLCSDPVGHNQAELVRAGGAECRECSFDVAIRHRLPEQKDANKRRERTVRTCEGLARRREHSALTRVVGHGPKQSGYGGGAVRRRREVGSKTSSEFIVHLPSVVRPAAVSVQTNARSCAVTGLGSTVSPVRYRSTDAAAARPSAIAQTISD